MKINNLTNEEIQANKEEFISLIKSINRDNVSGLIDYLENKSDFFIAPASTKYHGAFEGGLCKHSLEVYKNTLKLNDMLNLGIDIDSIKIAALLHDISKVNSYEKVFRNVKVYKPDGSKYDAGGNYDWETIQEYKQRDDRFIYSNHEATSEFIARQFLDLKIEESVAILHHHGGIGYDTVPSEVIGVVYNKYHLCLILHTADLLTAYVSV